MNYFNGTITASPVIETINCDTTESIATNVISITDGQIHTNKSLFLDPFRPATDSGPSATRIGSWINETKTNQIDLFGLFYYILAIMKLF
jgi:F0F1-type ATP synthase alpha subunit